ncbi:MAG: tyrosine-type recombinase/integrase [Candidatus Acidiferrales bacterium]
MAKLSIYKYVRTDKGWRYCKAAFHPNGKIKPNVVVVGGVEEKHTEGRYFLNFNNHWIDVGEDALEAQRKRLLRLNQMEYERLSGRSAAAAHSGQPSVVEFSGRKVIKDEVEAYFANLELAKRPHRTVQSKRRFLTTFLSIVPKKFADEFCRDDVLTFRNKLLQEYDPKSVDTMMMCVVTFFSRWLKIKLGVEKSDWPSYDVNDPEPYLDDEIVALEKVSTGIPNLLIRLFRSVGCRETKQSGAPKVKLHRFRDTFITNKLRDGVDVRTVQRWAGHEDVNVTMGYTAWLDGQSKAARDAANREDERYVASKTGTKGD